jgi:hypothetical protein
MGETMNEVGEIREIPRMSTRKDGPDNWVAWFTDCNPLKNHLMIMACGRTEKAAVSSLFGFWRKRVN